MGRPRRFMRSLMLWVIRCIFNYLLATCTTARLLWMYFPTFILPAAWCWLIVDTMPTKSCIEEQDARHTIPPKVNRTYQRRCDWWLYKERHLVECFFNKLQHFRRVATRYDKLTESFFAFVLLASISILLK